MPNLGNAFKALVQGACSLCLALKSHFYAAHSLSARTKYPGMFLLGLTADKRIKSLHMSSCFSLKISRLQLSVIVEDFVASGCRQQFCQRSRRQFSHTKNKRGNETQPVADACRNIQNQMGNQMQTGEFIV